MKHRGFTLVELLATLTVVSILAAILFAATGKVRASAHRAECAGNLRQLAAGVQLYANDHGGQLPRSDHSAFAHRQRSWLSTIQPYLGADEALQGEALDKAIERHCRCPSEEGRESGSSYGLNVHFELAPASDDYDGAPATWRRMMQIPAPSQTILLAELAPGYGADHVMAHFWGGDVDGAEVDIDRHDGQANYAFVDGHVECLPVKAIYDPANQINRWNPVLASRH